MAGIDDVATADYSAVVTQARRLLVARSALGLAPVLLAVLLALAADGRPPAAQAAPTPPHIVVIMADDLDVHIAETMLALGFLPNVRAYVVDRGVRFRQSFVTNSLCCPSRATYLSGRYSHNHGVLRNNAPYGSVAAFDDRSTVATWLSAVGYRTGHVGKYLNEYGQDPDAPETSPRNPRYVPPGWDDWQGLIDLSTYNVYNYWLNDNGTPVQHGSEPEDYQTAVLADRARRFISQSLAGFPGRPLFLTVTPIAPHIELTSMLLTWGDGVQYPDVWRWWIRPDPRDETRKPLRWSYIFQTLPLLPRWKPAFNEPDVSDKPAPLRRPVMTPADIDALTFQYRTRFASMLAVDDLVGVVAQALGPELANTVLVFTSDNGFLHGEHRMAEKVVAYEESIRVPLYVAGPGIPGGRTVDHIVLNNDLAPTIADLAGAIPASPVDGRSLRVLLDGSTPGAWRRRFLVEHWGSGSVIDAPTYAALRTGAGDVFPHRLYAEHFANPAAPGTVTHIELYDLTVDPDQLLSLHASPARAVERAALREQLATLRWCGAPGVPSCESLER